MTARRDTRHSRFNLPSAAALASRALWATPSAAPGAALTRSAATRSPERASGRSAGVVCPPRLNDGETQLVRGAWLGKGGFAAVWAVQQPASGAHYALKVVNKATLDAAARRKLVSEIELHTPLRHR